MEPWARRVFWCVSFAVFCFVLFLFFFFFCVTVVLFWGGWRSLPAEQARAGARRDGIDRERHGRAARGADEARLSQELPTLLQLQPQPTNQPQLGHGGRRRRAASDVSANWLSLTLYDVV